MTITEAVRARKSTRAYIEKTVPEDIINQVLEAGQWGPVAGDFHISAITNPELLEKINNLTYEKMLKSEREFLRQRAALPGYQPLYSAPVLILLSGPQEAPYTAVNTALSAENMLLEATGLGLGSCFLASPSMILNSPENAELKKEAGIPENDRVICAVIIGYPAAENKFMLGERKKKGTVALIS